MSEKRYLDVNAQDFGSDVIALVEQQREIYTREKAIKAQIVAALNAQVALGSDEVVGVCWTRWGQMQAIVAQRTAPKIAKVKQSLADYRAEQEANGHAH